MPTGIVKWFNESKGFGFIVPDADLPVDVRVACKRFDLPPGGGLPDQPVWKQGVDAYQ